MLNATKIKVCDLLITDIIFIGNFRYSVTSIIVDGDVFSVTIDTDYTQVMSGDMDVWILERTATTPEVTEINAFAISTGDVISATDAVGTVVEGQVTHRLRVGRTVTVRVWNSVRGVIEGGFDLYDEVRLIDASSDIDVALI